MATVFSQATTTIPSGTFTSPNFTMPTGIVSVTIAFTVASPDITDATKSMTYEMDRSDGVGGWLFDNGFTWVGNSIGNKTGLPQSPSITVDVGPLAGQICRMRLILPLSVQTAVLITTT
jgi:hypothetical protein